MSIGRLPRRHPTAPQRTVAEESPRRSSPSRSVVRPGRPGRGSRVHAAQDGAGRLSWADFLRPAPKRTKVIRPTKVASPPPHPS